VARMEERMDRRIASLALARFRVGGFVGTSIADLAGALGVSKAAIYYHYRSKDALLHRLVDPLLDAIDACIQDHTTPAVSARTARPLLGDYLAVLLAHREVVPLVATDVAVLNHPTIGPRLHAQNQQLQSLLTAPNTDVAARLRAEAAVGAIWRPLIAQPPLDLTSPAHQHILIDAAVATLQPSRPTPDEEPVPATHIGRHAEHF
jgi:AcrR family transcriptional regulator